MKYEPMLVVKQTFSFTVSINTRRKPPKLWFYQYSWAQIFVDLKKIKVSKKSKFVDTWQYQKFQLDEHF